MVELGDAGGIPEWAGRGVHAAILPRKDVCKDMEGPSYRAPAGMRTESQGKQKEGELDLSYHKVIDEFEAPHRSHFIAVSEGWDSPFYANESRFSSKAFL